jgi:hypothetical protein
MKLTEKEKRKLAAIVVFKCIERELNTLRQKGNVTCPESDSEIVDAIAGNINARRGQWRKTKPEGIASESLYHALRFRTGRTSTIGGIVLSGIRHGSEVADGFDTIACLLVRNRERISDMAKHALNRGN